MSAAIPILLALLTQLAGTVGTSGAGSIIATLTKLLPVVVQWGQDVYPLIKNVVDALKSNGKLTQLQKDDLTALEDKIDADFESAATATEAEDAATKD